MNTLMILRSLIADKTKGNFMALSRRWTFVILSLLTCLLSACGDDNSTKDHNTGKEEVSPFCIFDNIYSDISFSQLVLLLEDMQSGKMEVSENECRGYKSGNVIIENYNFLDEIPASLFFEFGQGRIWKIQIRVNADLRDQSIVDRCSDFCQSIDKEKMKCYLIDNTIYIEILSVRDLIYDFIRKNR